MGTKVECKSYFPGYHSMRDLNEDSNSCNWPLYYEDKSLTNGQYYNGFLPRAVTDSYPGCDRNSVKEKMLEHEAIFKNQVYELHRLYRIQRDMMDGAKGKEVHQNRTSLPLSPLASQTTSDARKWTNHSFPMVNSVYDRQSISVVEGIHSPLSSMEGTNMHTGPYAEVLESRPMKVQKKLFDLQLPADVYIDTEEEEQLSDKVSAISSSYRRDCKMAHANGPMFYLDDGRKKKVDYRGERSPTGLADLNEPIQLEDVKDNAPSYAFCNGKLQESGQSVKPNSHLLGLPKETSLNFYGSNIATRSNLYLHSNGNGSGREWFSHVPEVGKCKNNVQPFLQYVQTELPHSSQLSQVSTRSVYEQTFYGSDKSKYDLWKEQKISDAGISKRTPDLTSSKNLGLLSTSHVISPYQISPPNLAKPLPHSWEKLNSYFNHMPLSAQTSGGLNAVSNGSLGDRWYLDSNGRSNPAFGGELPKRNGFYKGSSSGSREQPIHIPSGSNENDTNDGLEKYCKASNCADTKTAKALNLNASPLDSSFNREMPTCEVKGLGAEKKLTDHQAVLPWVRAKSACKNEVFDFGHISKTGEMSIFRSLNQSPSMNDIEKDCNRHFSESLKTFSTSSKAQVSKNEPSDCPTNKRLLGFPIFDKPNDTPSLVPVSFTKPSETKVVNKLTRILDINLPCDPGSPDLFQQQSEDKETVVVVEREVDAKSQSLRHPIDLNSSLSDEEASLQASVPVRVKPILDIDLEAPAIPEVDEDFTVGEESELKDKEACVASPKCNVEVQQDELVTVAAEAIVAIAASICHIHAKDAFIDSSGTLPSGSADPLAWFVEIVSSCGDDLDAALKVEDSQCNEEDLSEEFDYFESMVLQLKETKEEEYMPAPLVQEDLQLEEMGSTSLTNRPRKGQSRRGRKRRDFQRDILPGLASLSRYEVTEDLQTFDALMQATGHSWHSGLTRRSSTRNGSGRGRRRTVVSPTPPTPTPTTPSSVPPPLVQMLNGIETGQEDRSLTSWGKTTRRPRRQRCSAAGNPTSVALN